MNENLWQRSWEQIEARAGNLIEKNYGGRGEPSIFKRAAGAAIAIVELAPIPSRVSDILDSEKNSLKNPLVFYPNSLRASAAYHFAVMSLTGITLHNLDKDKICLLEQIRPSAHFKNDLRYTLAQIAVERSDKPLLNESTTQRGEYSFNALSLMLESLAYEANGGFSHLGLLE